VSRGGSAPRATLEAVFRAALEAVDPEALVARAVERRADGALRLVEETLPPSSRLVVLAAGKAACAMARGLESVAGDRIARGLAVTKDGHALPLRRLDVVEAAHPVPDARCASAARAALALAEGVRGDETLVVLLSGGASALLTGPQPGLRQEDLSATTALLLAAGADIDELNAVRKHLGVVSGGRLASAARGARVVALVLSDVIGDRLDVIASGPCSGDPTSFGDALSALERHDLLARVPPRIRAQLEAGARGEKAETPKPGDPALAAARAYVLAGNADALAGARREAERRGFRTTLVSPALAGEARVAGRRLAALARAVEGAEPVVLLAGGETTVTVRGDGRGGRNQELALAAAVTLDGVSGVTLLAAGTDGTDGPTDAAGAFADGSTLARGTAAGCDARAALARNDSYGFFAREGGLLRTGPTRTNVMDLALVLCAPRGEPALDPS